MTSAQYKAQLRARKAAKLGMTLDQFDQYVADEGRRVDAINRILTDRGEQYRILMRHAQRRGHSFIIKVLTTKDLSNAQEKSG